MLGLQNIANVAHRLDLARVIVVPHIVYYVLVAVQMNYRFAAGVVAVVLVGEVMFGHHVHKETNHET